MGHSQTTSKKEKKVQTVRQVNANEVGDSQMMAISDEGVGVIQKLTIADRGGERGLWTPHFGWHNMWTAPYQKIQLQSILAHILPVHTCYWEKGY